MKKIDQKEKAVVIIGSGAGGGTMAYELTKAGIPCVCLEAGPFHKKEDYVNDEWGAFLQMAWLDTRTTSGNWRVAKDFSGLPTWLCKAVGGTTTHWAGATPRFMDYEFKTKSTYGNVKGASLLDWPVTLSDMEPYYTRAEDAIGSTHRGGRPALPANNNYKVFAEGAKRVGYKYYATGPYGTNAAPYDGRPGSIQDGFNFQGDKNGSKWSTAKREIPRALQTNLLDLRTDSHVTRITHDKNGMVDGVIYRDVDGNEQRQEAKVVILSGNSIESPRLLLMSDSSMFPDGLANSSGEVGRNYMRHLTGSMYARFEKPVNFYRGETMAGFCADEVKHNPKRGFVGGYYMETLALGPAFLGSFLEPGGWGREFTNMMDGYENIAGMWIVGEDMPQSKNRITLNTDVKDQYGNPVPNVHFDEHPNDIAMRTYAYEKAEDLYNSVGAVQTWRTPPYPSTHNLGTNRMSAKPKDGVVNKWGRTHDIKNLYIADGSVMTTGAAANPTLTITALSIRFSENVISEIKKGNI
ncbi:MAG: Fructose dehydrogenase large subunit [Alphaproteobacteria bacterium MarineAlpha9_Bin4]|nr:MAG: Fructose dehydrogenase large subunit [Alphaproteobacteria bacterium MarineAlpha9_Bin4]|tara:strand:- start:538 stop:2103 length:1566 start_codon:yes stop_codon:yes gene_type:complete